MIEMLSFDSRTERENAKISIPRSESLKQAKFGEAWKTASTSIDLFYILPLKRLTLMAVSLLTIAAGTIGAVILAGLLYIAPFSTLAVLGVLKAGLLYLWKVATPLWIVAKQRGPYKIAALFLTFTGFFTHFYSLSQTQSLRHVDLALTALANTLTGSLDQLAAAITTLLNGPTLLQFVAALYFIAVSMATWYLYWIGWGMLRKRVPHLTYYLLVAFSLILIIFVGTMRIAWSKSSI